VHGSLLRPEVAWVEVMFAAFCPRCEWKEGRKEGAALLGMLVDVPRADPQSCSRFDAYRGLQRCKPEITISEDTLRKDPFIEMVTAKASVDLRLSDYLPRSMLVVSEHEIRRPRFPVIDCHHHLDAQGPQRVLHFPMKFCVVCIGTTQCSF